MNKDILSTLFVGIDVSSANNYFCAINFEGKHLLDFSITNDLPSSELAIERIFNTLKQNDLKYVTIVLESTNVFSFHIANLLASKFSLTCMKTFCKQNANNLGCFHIYANHSNL